MAAADTQGPMAQEEEVEAAGTQQGTQQGAPEASVAPIGLREDQIQNAMSFLSHPKVRTSPADSKRTFLEKKGLTAADIDEAFRRVPDVPTASVPAGPSGLPLQAAAQPPHKPFPTGTAATLQQLQPQPIVQQPPPPQPIRWTQVVVGLGLLAAVGYAVKQYAVPKVTAWYQEWHKDSNKAASEEEAQKTAQLVASAIQAQTAEMQKTLGELKEAISTLEKGKAAATEASADSVTLSQLRSELRVLATSLNEFGSPGKPAVDAEESRKLDEIKTMVATVAGQLSARPIAVAPVQEPFCSPDRGGTWTNGAPSDQLPNGGPHDAKAEPLPQPPHPSSYMEVLEMLEQGKTPPGIREDIVDVPPNPLAPPPDARLKPRSKPWERSTPAAADGSGPVTVFPHTMRATVAQKDVHSVPARAPWSDGGPSFATQAAKPESGDSKAAGTNSSSSSSPVGVWKPPAVPQPSIPRSPSSVQAASPAASAASAGPSDNSVSSSAAAAAANLLQAAPEEPLPAEHP